MFPLFKKLSLSSDPCVRNHPLLVGPCTTNPIHSDRLARHRYRNSPLIHMSNTLYPIPFHARTQGWFARSPLWIRGHSYNERWPRPDDTHVNLVHPRIGFIKSMVYTFGDWIPYAVNKAQLPFLLPSSGGLLRSPNRSPGLLDAVGRCARIRDIGLGEALIYSFRLDSRFILLVCLLTGFSLYCFNVPLAFLENPSLIHAPNLGLLTEIGRDTFVDLVCTEHRTPSPCECGEPLNRELPIMLGTVGREFDPLDLGLKQRSLGVATFLGIIILCLTLSESVCCNGISLP